MIQGLNIIISAIISPFGHEKARPQGPDFGGALRQTDTAAVRHNDLYIIRLPETDYVVLRNRLCKRHWKTVDYSSRINTNAGKSLT